MIGNADAVSASDFDVESTRSVFRSFAMPVLSDHYAKSFIWWCCVGGA
jgi:hypothetical protein